MKIAKGFTRKATGAGLACAVFSLATLGHATPVTFSSIGDSTTISYTGLVDIDGVTTPVPDLTAETTFELTNIDGNDFVFSVSVSNTADPGIFQQAELRSIGFNTNPDVIAADATDDWEATLDENFPVGFGFVDVCAFISEPGSCLGGQEGLGIGANSGFDLILSFAELPDSVTVDNFVVRWFRLTSEELGFEDQSGIGVPVPVPEPSPLALLALGLLGMGLLARRRKAGLSA